MATREANVALSATGADATKQNFKEVEEALDAVKDAGKATGQGVSDALRNIENANQRVTDKISQGRAVTIKDGAAIQQQMLTLRESIDKTFGSLAQAPVAVQQAFAKADAQVKQTTTTVAKLTDEVQDNKDALKEGGVAWTGFGDAINKSIGPLGGVQVKMMAAAAAFSAGWDIGMKLNKMFGTDVTLWEETIARFGAKAGAIIKALSDNVIAVWNIVYALFTGNMAEVKRGFAELANNVVATGKVVHDVATKWGDDWDRLHPSIKQVEEGMKKTAEAAEKLAEQKKKLADATAKLTAEIDKTNVAITKQDEVMDKNQKAMLDAEHVRLNRTSDEKHFSREIEETTKRLNEQKAKVEELTAAHGANDPMTLAAIESQKRLEQELARSGKQYDGAKKDVEDYKKKQEESSKAIDDAWKKMQELSEQLKKQQTELAGLPAHLDTVTASTTALATSAGKAAPETTRLADGMKQVTQHAEPAAKAVNAAAAAVTAFDVGPATAQWKQFDAVIASVVSNLQAIAASAPAAIHAVESLGDAAGKAAGSGAAGAAAASGGGTVH